MTYSLEDKATGRFQVQFWVRMPLVIDEVVKVALKVGWVKAQLPLVCRYCSVSAFWTDIKTLAILTVPLVSDSWTLPAKLVTG